MALRPIVLYPDPVLLEPTRRVESIDDRIRALVRDMVETMYAAPGIGLAAPQVGVSRRVNVIDVSSETDPAQRALGGPVLNLIAAGMFVSLLPGTEGFFSNVLKDLIGTNLFFGIGSFLPIPTVDGNVIWREILRPWRKP